MFKNIAAVVFSLLVFQSALGQVANHPVATSCDGATVKRASDYLNIQDLQFDPEGKETRNDDQRRVIASACKRWSFDRSLMIVAFSFDAGVQDEKQLIVSLVDTSTNKVVAAYKGTIAEDATMTVGAGSLSIDMARYDIAPGVRAFGVDLSTSFSQGCVDGGFGPTRTLFVSDGKNIRPILEGLYLSTWTFAKGGPSCDPTEREVVVETTSYTVDVLRTVTRGFADLRITATPTLDNGKPSPKKPGKYTIKYDGKFYPIGQFISW